MAACAENSRSPGQRVCCLYRLGDRNQVGACEIIYLDNRENVSIQIANLCVVLSESKTCLKGFKKRHVNRHTTNKNLTAICSKRPSDFKKHENMDFCHEDS